MGKSNKRASWNKVGGRSREEWKENQEDWMSVEKFGGYKTEEKYTIERTERLALRNTVKLEVRLEIHGGLGGGIRMKRYLQGPKEFAKTLKLRFHVGDLGLPGGRKRYTSSREEEVYAQMCPFVKSIESRIHIYSRRM